MKIAIINTGGTISCHGQPLTPMSAADFAAASQSLLDPIFTKQFPEVSLSYITDLVFPDSGKTTLDSTNLQPLDWCVVAQRILADYQDFDAWVVLHGTDSMAYTASALPFLLSAFDATGLPWACLDKPVILTGSQVPLFQGSSPEQLHFSTDAYQNFCAAIAFARTAIPEVAVAFRGHLYRGSRTVKSNADMDHAFTSPNAPALGNMGINLRINTGEILPGPIADSVSLSNARVLDRMRERIAVITKKIAEVTVVPVSAFPATYGNDQAKLAAIIEAILSTGVQGLILESYGEGNFPSGNGLTEESIRQATARGIIVVNCTQVISGTVNDGAYAAGSWMPGAGVISAQDITPIAAFAKATVLFAEADWNNWSIETVKQLICTSLLGEMRQSNRRRIDWQSELAPGESLHSWDGAATLVNSPTDGMKLVDDTGETTWQLTGSPLSPPYSLLVTSEGIVIRSRGGVQALVFAAAGAYALNVIPGPAITVADSVGRTLLQRGAS